MHRGGRGYEGGKGGGKAFDRSGGNANWSSYRNDVRDDPPPPPAPPARASANGRGGRGAYRDNDDQSAAPAATNGSGDEVAEAVFARLEGRVSSVQKEFMQALHQKSQKENDKFDLIFGILSELQSRQAQLEDMVLNLHQQYGNNGMNGGMANGMGGGGMAMSSNQGQMVAPQFGTASGGTQYYQHQMNGGMGVQQQPMVMQQVVMVPAQQQPQMQMRPVGNMSPGGPGMSSFGPMAAAPSTGHNTPEPPEAVSPHNVMQEPSAASPDSSSASATANQPSLSQEASSSPQEQSSPSKDKWKDGKIRMWKAVSIPEGESIPVVMCNEPYTPCGRAPEDHIVLRWLKNGDIVRQMGHSKKMKGWMVMPVRVIDEKTGDEEEVEGFVTRRSLDKTRDTDVVYFEEVLEDGVEKEERHERWKPGSRDS